MVSINAHIIFIVQCRIYFFGKEKHIKMQELAIKCNNILINNMVRVSSNTFFELSIFIFFCALINIINEHYLLIGRSYNNILGCVFNIKKILEKNGWYKYCCLKLQKS